MCFFHSIYLAFQVSMLFNILSKFSAYLEPNLNCALFIIIDPLKKIAAYCMFCIQISIFVPIFIVLSSFVFLFPFFAVTFAIASTIVVQILMFIFVAILIVKWNWHRYGSMWTWIWVHDDEIDEMYDFHHDNDNTCNCLMCKSITWWPIQN